MTNRRKTAEIYTHTHTHTHTGSFLNGLKQIVPICFAFLLSVFSTNLFATGISASATSASCDNPTLGTYSGTSNLQANWQANQINLAWYSDDTQITNVQNAATSCNYDGTLTVPSNVPTKTGYTFNGWTVRGLPSGYTRLEYIQSSGTQYINTGITVAAGTSVRAVIQGQGDTGVVFSFDQDWTGAYVKEGSNKFCGAGQCFGPSSIKTTVLSSWTGSSGSITQTVAIDGVTKTYTCSRSYGILTIFMGRAWENASSYWAGKVYAFEMYQNSKLVRELIPAKNSSNVVGLYDTVSKTFFTNAGTGTFTAGPVVQ